jgi:hypothetical protein
VNERIIGRAALAAPLPASAEVSALFRLGMHALPAAEQNPRIRLAKGDSQVQPESLYVFAIVARGLFSKAEPPGHFARDGSLS